MSRIKTRLSKEVIPLVNKSHKEKKKEMESTNIGISSSGSIKKDPFSEIPRTRQQKITEAVGLALDPNSMTPIILKVYSDDTQDIYDLAYWPKSQEIGEHLMKIIILTRMPERDLHANIVFSLTNDYCVEDMFSALPDDINFPFKVKHIADLGTIQKILHFDMEEEEGVVYCDSEKLDTRLFVEECYVN